MVTFKAALKEDIETAVKIESGVISIYAVYDIDRPTHVIVFEVFESKKAHAIHQQTPHFEKYKNIIKNMVKSVKRTEVSPIVLGKNSIVPD